MTRRFSLTTPDPDGPSTHMTSPRVATKSIPSNTSAYAGFGKLVQEVIGAAYQDILDRAPVTLLDAALTATSPARTLSDGGGR